VLQKSSVETIKQDILRPFVQNLAIVLIVVQNPQPFESDLFPCSGADDTKRTPLSYKAVHLPGISRLSIQIKNQTTHCF
jgi:hypothetical protein